MAPGSQLFTFVLMFLFEFAPTFLVLEALMQYGRADRLVQRPQRPSASSLCCPGDGEFNVSKSRTMGAC